MLQKYTEYRLPEFINSPIEFRLVSLHESRYKRLMFPKHYHMLHWLGLLATP